MKKLGILLAVTSLAACDGATTEPVKAAGPPIEITSKALAAKYAENEVAAKGELDGHLLVVTGKIQSIELDLMDKPTVMLPGKDDFTMVHVNFTEAAQTKTSALKKGETLTVSCASVSEVMGSPMLADCSF